MAQRDIRLQTKRSEIPSQSLPSNTKRGEAVVNLGDGIMYYSGGTSGSPTWIPSGLDAGYFEVGSHLTNQYLDGRITGYQGTTSLNGKFLSGTTTGFVLADISDIQGVDTNSYVTGFTWNPNQLIISRNDGLPNLVVPLDTFSGLTITNNLDLQGNLYNSGGNVTIQDNLTVNGNLTITGTTNLEHNNLNGLQGGTSGEYFHTTQTIHNALTASTSPSTSNPFATINDIAAASGDTQQVKVSNNDSTPGFLEDKITGGTNVTLTVINGGGNELLQINSTDTNTDTNFYVTGGTISGIDSNSNSGNVDLTYVGVADGTYTLSAQDTFTTGGTLSGTDLILTKNDGNTVTVDLSTLSTVDTYVTGFTYDDANTITLSRNEGQPDITVDLSTMASVTMTGDLDLQGELANSTGNVVINDNLDITGTTTSWGDILPGVHLGYDLGADGQRWDELWVRKVRLGTTTTILEDGKVTVTGGTTDYEINPNGDLVVDGDVMPPSGDDLVHTLGSPSRRWQSVNVGDVVATGLTISGLGSGRVVYTDGSGGLTTESTFTYNEGADTLITGNINVNNPSNPMTIGQGGLTVGSGGVGDMVVNGDLTVLGDTTTVSTSELYIEDPSITLNYNPTGSTIATSLGAGMQIQDGSGDVATDIEFSIGQLYLNGNINSNAEYLVGNEPSELNRGWFTNLNDILIRNTNGNSGAPDGKRILAEDDCLDGGTY